MIPGEGGLQRIVQKRALSIDRLRVQASLVSLDDEADGQSEPSRLTSKIYIVFLMLLHQLFILVSQLLDLRSLQFVLH